MPDPQRYVLLWLAYEEEIRPRTLTPIRRAIEDLAQDGDIEIDIWLESPGGDANTAYKLALLLRDAASHIRVVIPDYAKSAATLLALVGDEIYMAPAAELGPLDAQMPEEGSIEGAISALSIAHAADAVAEDAVLLAGKGGAQLMNQTGLSRAETLNAMLHFSAEISEPLVRQLNPTLVHRAKELLRVTTRYASRLLEQHHKPPRAEYIATELVENFPTHGYVIDLVEAQNLDLPAKPISEYELLHVLRPLHRAAEDEADFPFISLMALGELLEAVGIKEGDEPAEERTNGDEAEDGPAVAPAKPKKSRKRRPKN